MDILQHNESDHSHFVLISLNRFRLTEPKLCDFSIHVEGTHFPCHRSVLCIFSKFFRAAIQGRFREDTENCVHLKVTNLFVTIKNQKSPLRTTGNN